MQHILTRRWLWATVLLAAVVGAGYLLLPPMSETGVSKANFERIQKGWTDKQVADLLGGWGHGSIELRGAWAQTWWGDESDLIMVVFDEGVVTDKEFSVSLLTPWERTKRRINRRIKTLWPKW